MVVDALHGIAHSRFTEGELRVDGLHVGQDSGGVGADPLHAGRDAGADGGRGHSNAHHICRGHLAVHVDAHHVRGGDHVEDLNIVLVLADPYVEGADVIQVVREVTLASLDSGFERSHFSLKRCDGFFMLVNGRFGSLNSIFEICAESQKETQVPLHTSRGLRAVLGSGLRLATTRAKCGRHSRPLELRGRYSRHCHRKSGEAHDCFSHQVVRFFEMNYLKVRNFR